MICIGAVYAILGNLSAATHTEDTTRAALWLCTFTLIAMLLTGYVGYFVVDSIWPSFYYSPVTEGKNVWLFMQLACMVIYVSAGAIIPH
jgi:hypothetical protein